MRLGFWMAGALSVALTGAAAAQVTTATFTDGSHFDYNFKNLPDLDQRRTASGSVLGLPNDGDSYCVPTSSTNLVCYLAAHGYPLIAPGPQDWTDPTNYDLATLTVFSMGTLMGTNPTHGTPPGGGPAGLASWIAGKGPYIVLADFATGNHSPTLTTITEMAVTGPLMDVCVGRYDIIGMHNSLPLVVHNGGHSMTLARTHANGASDKKLWTRDPAGPDDGMELTQSTFANHQFSVTPKALYIDGTPPLKVTMSVLNYDSSDTILRCIDRYVAVQGLGAVFATNHGGLNSTIDFYAPVELSGLPVESVQPFAVSGPVLDTAVDPDHFGITFLAGGLVQDLNAVTGAITNLGSFPTASKLVYGRKREIYVLSPTVLQAFDPEDGTPTIVPQPEPSAPQALCYDDVHDQVVELCNALHALFVFPAGLPSGATVVQVPSAIPMSGKGSITVNPADGKYWLVSDASDSIFGVMVTNGNVSSIETISDPAIVKPLQISSDDNGRLFVQTMNKLFILAKGPNGWSITQDPLWDAYPPTPCFHVMTSRSNFDPATMTGPAYDDLTQADLESWEQGPSIPDCGNDAADNPYGVGKAGSNGVPQLAALDPPFLGAPSTVQLTHGLPGALPILLAGLSQRAQPFDQGTLLVTPTFVVTMQVPIDGNGSFSLTVTLPGDTALCGTTLYEQMMFVDPAAPGFHHSAQTNGLARMFGS